MKKIFIIVILAALSFSSIAQHDSLIKDGRNILSGCNGNVLSPDQVKKIFKDNKKALRNYKTGCFMIRIEYITILTGLISGYEIIFRDQNDNSLKPVFIGSLVSIPVLRKLSENYIRKSVDIWNSRQKR